jgi:putative restriction endonuclease
MPAISPRALVAAITSAFVDSGYSGQLTSPARAQPRRFVVVGSDATSTVDVYAWTLTFGGRVNLPNEYRIQMTSVTSPLQISPEVPTILIGYDPQLNLFAGFDSSAIQRSRADHRRCR